MMFVYQVVIRADKRKGKRGEMMDVNEYYVSDNVEEVYQEAMASVIRWDGELVGIVRRDPILKIFKKARAEERAEHQPTNGRAGHSTGAN